MLLMLAFSLAAFAQGQTVSGTVTDADDGSGIPGVNIVEKGTSNGTITDVEGNYTLNVSDGAVLVYSYVGYISQEITVGAQSSIDVALAADVTQLSEVVVVGYGTQEKKEISSAVVSVKPEDFNQGNVNDPAQLIQGKVAGLSISRPGGDPNGGFNIRLRGLSTVGANTEPLIVIDGVIGGRLENVDPNDIASFDVLKDGSAAAIYGTRASSGVILITTKRGQEGRPKLDYNGYVAMDAIARDVPVMSAQEYAAVGGTDLGDDIDWMDEVTRTGVSNVHNLALSGGTQTTSYRFSANYRNVEGILEGSGFERVNARMSLQQKMFDNKLIFSTNISNTTNNKDVGFTEALRYAVYYNPTAPIRFGETGNPATDVSNPNNVFEGYFEQQLFDLFNPVAIVEQNINEEEIKNINGDIRVDYEVIDGLVATATYAIQRENIIKGQYYRKNAFFRGANANGLARRENIDKFKQQFELYGNYNTDINEVNLSVLAGYSYQEENETGDFFEAGNFLSDANSYHNIEDAADIANGLADISSFRKPNHKTIAFFGRVNANISGTYFLSASLRYEGDTRFGADNKWGAFPAFSGAVELTNLVDIPSVNSLKARVGYGVTGAIPRDDGLSVLLYELSGNVPTSPGNFIPAASPVRNFNPDLQWEEKEEFDIGVDFSMLDERLYGSIDWYTRTTTDFIQEVAVNASINIASQTFLNVGEFKNSGFEFAVNYDVYRDSDFRWTTGVVGSTYSTELVDLFLDTDEQDRANLGSPGQNQTPLIKVREGEDIGNIWGPVLEAVDENGFPVFADLDGDDVYCDCDDDKTVIGNGLPDFELGWTNSLSYKNWDFQIFFRGSFGHDLVNTYRAFYEPLVPGQINSYNRVKSEYFNENLRDAQFSDYYVEDASFFKLDNMSIGYTVPLAETSALRNLRLYVSGQNLFVITAYEGVDPAVRFADVGATDNGGRPENELNPDPLAPGIDRRSTYFRPYTLTFGVNIGL